MVIPVYSSALLESIWEQHFSHPSLQSKPALKGQLFDILRRSLNPNPDDRISFEDIVKELDKILETRNPNLWIHPNLLFSKEYESVIDIPKQVLELPYHRTLFHYFSFSGNIEMLEILSARYGGQYLHQPDSLGFTCAHFAARNNHYQLLEYLVDIGVNVSMEDKYYGINPLMTAIQYNHKESVMVLAKQTNLDAGYVTTPL